MSGPRPPSRLPGKREIRDPVKTPRYPGQPILVELPAVGEVPLILETLRPLGSVLPAAPGEEPFGPPEPGNFSHRPENEQGDLLVTFPLGTF